MKAESSPPVFPSGLAYQPESPSWQPKHSGDVSCTWASAACDVTARAEAPPGSQSLNLNVSPYLPLFILFFVVWSLYTRVTILYFSDPRRYSFFKNLFLYNILFSPLTIFYKGFWREVPVSTYLRKFPVSKQFISFLICLLLGCYVFLRYIWPCFKVLGKAIASHFWSVDFTSQESLLSLETCLYYKLFIYSIFNLEFFKYFFIF